MVSTLMLGPTGTRSDCMTWLHGDSFMQKMRTEQSGSGQHECRADDQCNHQAASGSVLPEQQSGPLQASRHRAGRPSKLPCSLLVGHAFEVAKHHWSTVFFRELPKFRMEQPAEVPTLQILMGVIERMVFLGQKAAFTIGSSAPEGGDRSLSPLSPPRSGSRVQHKPASHCAQPSLHRLGPGDG